MMIESDPQRIVESDGHITSKMAKCRNCRFYHHGESECRRRAPSHTLAYTIGEAPEAYSYIWPTTSDDDWCGDFERGVNLARETVEEQAKREP